MPPYSDNLYSANDDSDGESFSDELSPTDGYFGAPQMPTNVIVPDPSLDYGPTEAKTLIPPPDSQASTERSMLAHPSRLPQMTPSQSYAPPHSSDGHSTSLTQYTPASPISSRRRDPSFSEQDSSMFNPPPAYSESPSNSESPILSLNSSQTFSRGIYSTFPETHLERGFLPRREPESMVGQVDEPTERTPLVPEGIRYSPRRRKVKALLFAALVLAVFVTTLSIVFGCKSSRSYSDVDWKHPKSPSDAPLDSKSPYCPTASLKKDQAVYEFSTGMELTIIQKSHGFIEGEESKGRTAVSTEGEIRLRKTPKNSEHGKKPYLTIDMGATTDLSLFIDWSEDSQTLELSTPIYVEKYLKDYQCLYVIITAWFPEDAEFTNLRFDATTLNMALSDINVNVTGRSKFTTIAGDVWLNTEVGDISAEASKYPAMSSKPGYHDLIRRSELQFLSRRIVIETISGSITGTYSLLDDLLLSSQSGEITVEVSPQPASKSTPAPADLEVQTASGAIRVDFPIEGTHRPGYTPPFRNYITRVHSTTGDIFGTYYLGSDSSFKTTSGSIDITTLPVLPTRGDSETTKVPPNVFETHTVSGSAKINVRDPIFFSSLSPSHQKPPYISANDEDPYITILPVAPSSSIDPSGLREQSEFKKPKLRSLRSAHSSNTGQVLATYPDAWQGSVHAKTVSSEIVVSGEGFRTVKSRKGWAFREVLKRRGVEGAGEGCTVEMSDISGELEFYVSKV